MADIFCTIWFEEDDAYTGVIAKDGGLLETGVILFNHYNAIDKAKQLIENGAEKKVGCTLDECIQMDNGKEMIFRNLSLGTMKMVAEHYTNGAYVYIYNTERKEWLFGKRGRMTLAQALK